MKIEKVYAYITYGDRLLVFKHTRFPEAGVQVPGGTVEEGESLGTAVLREAKEETGLQELTMHAYLGELDYDLAEVGGKGIHHRHFFQIYYSGRQRTRWRNFEMYPSDDNPEPIELEFYWAKFSEGLPQLLTGQGALLNKMDLQFN